MNFSKHKKKKNKQNVFMHVWKRKGPFIWDPAARHMSIEVWIWPKVAHPVYLELTPQNELCLALHALSSWKGVGRVGHIHLLMHVKLPVKPLRGSSPKTGIH